MGDLSAYSSWSAINIFAVLLISLLLANVVKKNVKIFKKSLIPTSVLAGIFVFILATIYNFIAKKCLLETEFKPFFDTAFFGGNGYSFLEVLTYHMLGLGFIASTLKSANKKMTKKRSVEIFDSGVTTVCGYLLQGVIGLGITLIAAATLMPNLFKGSGVLLLFGYGQGTGQAFNFGSQYQEVGFKNGSNFGLTIAAFGFLSASIGGVFHLMMLKRKNPAMLEELSKRRSSKSLVVSDDAKDGTLGKLTVQIVLCLLCYFITYLIMLLLGNLIPGQKATIYGFNFLFGVISALLVKTVINLLRKKRIIKHKPTNNYLLNNIENFCFDIMIVAGIAAIRLDIISNYLGILLILGVAGAVLTYLYTKFVAKKLFPAYWEEQFLATYGMLTGTASTGVVLLREIDPEFQTEASDNLVYQTLPAICFGFPFILIANPTFLVGRELIVWIICFGGFILLNLLLFRSKIFRRKNKACAFVDGEAQTTTTESAEE